MLWHPTHYLAHIIIRLWKKSDPKYKKEVCICYINSRKMFVYIFNAKFYVLNKIERII